MTWRLLDPERIRTYDGGDAVMLFNPVSWATHRAGPLVLWVIEQLRQDAQTQEQLFHELCLNGEDPATLKTHLSTALVELARCGIIQQDPLPADA